MTDVLYDKFVKHWLEVTDIPPQKLGRFTPLYKKLASRLKVMPWPVLVVGSWLMVVGLYILLGSTVTHLVTLLQRGF